MCLMRTTLTLDRDVAEGLQREVRRTSKTFKAAVNDALRLGLGLSGKRPKAPRFRVRPHRFGFMAGIDLDRMNQLVDELEAQESARHHRR